MKKVISLLLVCLMMFSTVAIVSAANLTVSVTSLDKADAEIKSTTNLDVYVNISEFPADNVGLVDLVINFDPSELIFNSVRVGEIVTSPIETVEDGWLDDNYEGSVEDAIDGEGFAPLAATGWVTNKDNANDVNHADAGVLRIATNMPGYAYSNLYKNGKDKLVCIRFRKNMDGVGGSQEVKVAAINFASTESDGSFDLNAAANVTYEAGYIVLPGGAEPEPVETVVKTFPKRFYADNALTTVGVILEGDNYDEAKVSEAGVNVKADVEGEEEILSYKTAPIASDSDAKKSYVIVTLGGISETTKVKATSATQAYIKLDGAVIAGDYVDANATDANDVENDVNFKD